MTAAFINENVFLAHRLANWLVSKSSDHSATSKIKYHLGGRLTLLGTSLFFLADAVGRAVGGCMAFVGYLITLGFWQWAKNFGSDQMQKGAQAGSVSLSCFQSIFSPSPKELVGCLPRDTGSAACYPFKLQNPFTLQMLSQRIRQGTELISNKLRKEFKHAQDQTAKEPDKAFQYLSAPANFQGYTQSERIAEHEVGVCHFIGRRLTMEDEYLTTSFNLMVGGRAYLIQLFGIFDGHRGGEASRYVKENLKRQLYETLNEFCAKGLTDEAIWNALKLTFVKLNQEFKGPCSGTTVTVAIILDGKLWTANIGDSRTILDNGIQLSEDAKPADPRYQKGIEKRGGHVFYGRVNNSLAVARALGDHDISAISARPKITVYPLSTILKGSHLILACDGIYDVSSTRQIANAVQTHKDESADELAKNIVYSAYQAGSKDNLSALVVKL
jgi:serine/threonine protein phosphatase PrpC